MSATGVYTDVWCDGTEQTGSPGRIHFIPRADVSAGAAQPWYWSCCQVGMREDNWKHLFGWCHPQRTCSVLPQCTVRRPMQTAGALRTFPSYKLLTASSSERFVHFIARNCMHLITGTRRNVSWQDRKFLSILRKCAFLTTSRVLRYNCYWNLKDIDSSNGTVWPISKVQYHKIRGAILMCAQKLTGIQLSLAQIVK